MYLIKINLNAYIYPIVSPSNANVLSGKRISKTYPSFEVGSQYPKCYYRSLKQLGRQNVNTGRK